MAHGTAEQVRDKWLGRIQAATQEMQDGVNRVTVSPGDAAAAKKQKWINALMDARTQDKWERNVRIGGSLDKWRAAMLGYGINRVAQGAQAKQDKYLAAITPLLTYIDQVRAKVRTMDDSTPAARENRMLANMRMMRDYRRPSA